VKLFITCNFHHFVPFASTKIAMLETQSIRYAYNTITAVQIMLRHSITKCRHFKLSCLALSFNPVIFPRRTMQDEAFGLERRKNFRKNEL